jgi:hypothetical protein
MNAIAVNDALLAVLKGSPTLAEVRDTQGTIIGFFVPVSVEHAAEYARAAAHFNPQELRRRREAPGKGYTTQEVLQYLESLEPS